MGDGTPTVQGVRFLRLEQNLLNIETPPRKQPPHQVVAALKGTEEYAAEATSATREGPKPKAARFPIPPTGNQRSAASAKQEKSGPRRLRRGDGMESGQRHGATVQILNAELDAFRDRAQPGHHEPQLCLLDLPIGPLALL